MNELKKDVIEKFSLKQIGMDKLLLILAAGILMMLGTSSVNCNDKRDKNNIITDTTTSRYDYNYSLENGLKEMIEKIDGVKSAEVMITLKGTGEKIVLKENPYEQSEQKENSGNDTMTQKKYIYSDTSVMVTDSNGNTSPYVIKELEPEIQGIAVLYSGRTGPEITYKITQIIKSLFEIETHKISVIEQ